MKFYTIFVPCFIVATVLGTHYFFKWWTWIKELRRDEEKRKHIDYLLGDQDIQKWYEEEYKHII